MPKRFHFLMDLWDCSEKTLNNELAMAELLQYFAKLLDTYSIEEPYTVSRNDGVSAFIVTSTNHFTIHTFPKEKEVSIDVFSWVPFDMIAIRNYAIKYFEIDTHTIKVHRISGYHADEIRCEEPECTRQATREWGGRLVCQDHYLRYRDKELEFMDSTNSYS
ncbi:MAG: S-adenosylmethionine decarboxylase [Candidatus Woesearchaeota archaeon]